MRTNSEAVLTVRLPEDRKTWNDVAASSRVIVQHDTQIELLTYGRNADFMSLFFTVMVGNGSAWMRPLKWLARIATHPLQWLTTLWPFGWSRRTMMMLVMQARDNAMALRAKRRWLRGGFRLATEQGRDKPIPTYLEVARRAAIWLAQRTGGIAQSFVFEPLNIPMTAHVLGGAAIGADASSGVIDRQLRVFGYQNMLVCDAAAMPANPGVNPALTITALAEYAMAQVPAAILPQRSS